jgi:hypothetical protein
LKKYEEKNATDSLIPLSSEEMWHSLSGVASALHPRAVFFGMIESGHQTYPLHPFSICHSEEEYLM